MGKLKLKFWDANLILTPGILGDFSLSWLCVQFSPSILRLNFSCSKNLINFPLV